MENKQTHVTIPGDMHSSLMDICPEKGEFSILTRKLYRAFLRHMDVEEAGKSVAESWREEE